MFHAKQAQERIKEFDRLQRARYLLDAISLINDLLADGSEVEVLTLAGIIVRRLNKLGVTNVTVDKEDGMYFYTLAFEFPYVYKMHISKIIFSYRTLVQRRETISFEAYA